MIDLQNPNNVILIRNDPFFGYISVLKYPKAKYIYIYIYLNRLNNLLKKYLEDQSTSKLIPNFVVKDVQFPGTNLQVAFRTSQIKEKMSAARGTIFQIFVRGSLYTEILNTKEQIQHDLSSLL